MVTDKVNGWAVFFVVQLVIWLFLASQAADRIQLLKAENWELRDANQRLAAACLGK